MTWNLELRGGCYDGWTGEFDVDPRPVLIVWVCDQECEGHATFDLVNPAIVLRSAVAYRLLEVDVDDRHAIYEVGDLEPAGDLVLEAPELVGAGPWTEHARAPAHAARIVALLAIAAWSLVALPGLIVGGVL